MIRAEHITKSFDGRVVLDDISIEFLTGKTNLIIGRSGSGKTVLLKTLVGLHEPDSGDVWYDDTNFTRLDFRERRAIRKDIGMIFQEPMTSLNPVIRVGEQVAEPLMRHLRLPKKAALAEAVELFRLVGIPAPDMRVRDYPHQLSGGMRQRVMIAMALACKPRLLLADEPTTALDVTIQGQILALLGDLSRERGMGLLLITHDLGVVAEMADEVGVMYAGRIVERAPVRALFAEPRHPYTWGLIRSAPTLDTPPSAKLDAIPGTVPSPGDLPQGCPFRPRCPEAHERCFKTPPVIESAGPDGAREVCCWLAEAR